MRKGILYSSIASFTLMVVALVFFVPSNTKEYYSPRESADAKFGFQGAADYLHQMRANQITGEIDPADVKASRAQSKALRENTKNKKSSLGLQWQEVGPDNIGGRSRCMIISNKDPKIFFLGSVSGGLFKSVNTGASWSAINDTAANLAVVSLGQSADGEIVYYGTGEGMYYATTGRKTGGITGGGLFKSTDGGQTFDYVVGTNIFSSIGKVEVDPNNSQRVYIATNSGVRVSTDGGASWNIPNGLNTQSSPDMTITSSGVVWAKNGAHIYKSDASGDNFSAVSKFGAGPTELPSTGNRTRIAVSPQDENYVYVTVVDGGNNFSSAHRSTDGGATWSIIGQSNAFLNPHGGQGTFCHALEVSPQDKDRIFVGGTNFWEWSMTNGWFQITDYFPNATGSNVLAGNWVHPDLHKLVFHPNDPNTIYLTTDGGVFRSKDNGVKWYHINRKYSTLQFYNIAVGNDLQVLGGAQDNSNIYINEKDYYFPMNGDRLFTGDGGETEISHLNPDLFIFETQYGNAVRSVDRGATRQGIFDLERMAPHSKRQPGDVNRFGDFVTPMALYEDVFDTKSIDSIQFKADSIYVSAGLGGGKTTFSATFKRPQASTNFHPDGVKISAGVQSATTDASGNFIGPDVASGSFDAATGSFTIEFNAPVNNEVEGQAAVFYDAGDTLEINSITNEIPNSVLVPVGGLGSNDSIKFQDQVQSAFFIGLIGYDSIGGNDYGGIWMTRNIVSSPVKAPEWWHIGKINNGETPTVTKVSRDGDVLFVGCSNGRVYRFSNLSNARDSASADVDDFYDNGTITRPNTSVILKTTIAGLPIGRCVTDIAIDPRDNNRVVITYGQYGNNNYVYYSTNALSAAPVFVSKQGDLPRAPVYSAVFNAMGGPGEVLLGTEQGVYTADNIATTSVKWQDENNGLANVPVFDLIQYFNARRDINLFGNKEGAIYAGTHGRGVFKTLSTEAISIRENDLEEEVSEIKTLNVYPNPTVDKVFVPLNLASRSDVEISVRDINGKLHKSMKLNNVSQDVENVEVNVNSLPTGTYIITLVKGTEVISGKLIKQ